MRVARRLKALCMNALVEVPGHVVETTEGLVGKDVERGGREVERKLVASHATVSDRDLDSLALPYKIREVSDHSENASCKDTYTWR